MNDTVELWKNKILELNEIHLPNVPLKNDKYRLDDTLQEALPLLEKTNIEDMEEFLKDPEYLFLFHRIIDSEKLQYSCILFVYFFSRKYRSAFPNKYWDNDIDLLRRVYTDMGISFEFMY